MPIIFAVETVGRKATYGENQIAKLPGYRVVLVPKYGSLILRKRPARQTARKVQPTEKKI